MKSFDWDTYLSPFTWRYGSVEMRQIWSESYKRKLWRKVWVALARAQHKAGLVSKEELDDLIKNQDKIDIEKAHAIEKEIGHDLVAEIKTYAHQAKKGGGKIHFGATSMDIEDNADAIRIKESLVIVENKLKKLIKAFAKKVDTYKNFPCMGYTHLQPAEPTTLGYRFAFYLQDLMLDLKLLNFVKSQLKGKGIKGAVGTSASFTLLLDRIRVEKMEREVMKELDINAVTIANQTAPRKLEYFLAMLSTSIAASLYKFAFDLRISQSPGFGELQEPFSPRQVGSSAMPFKKNPVKSEQICSLARLIFNLANVARDNSAHMLLERTLDDSANRRIFLPEMFLAIDEILSSANRIIEGLVVNENQIKMNLDKFGPYAATEAILIEAVKKGADRQKMHEILRELSLKPYPLTKLLANDKRITKFIKPESLLDLLDAKKHIGLASRNCEELLKKLNKTKI